MLYLQQNVKFFQRFRDANTVFIKRMAIRLNFVHFNTIWFPVKSEKKRAKFPPFFVRLTSHNSTLTREGEGERNGKTLVLAQQQVQKLLNLGSPIVTSWHSTRYLFFLGGKSWTKNSHSTRMYKSAQIVWTSCWIMRISRRTPAPLSEVVS